MIQKNIFLISILFLSACANQPVSHDGVTTLSESEYEDIYNTKTNNIETYSGLTNALTFSSTEIDTEMINATLARSARVYEWNATKFAEESARAKANTGNKSEFFVSFYTPERNNNDLSSSHSIWKIYLDVNNQRYEGKATRLKGSLVDIQSMYPSHNRFSTAYMIEFPVAVANIEKVTKTLTITGPKTTARVIFKN